MQLVREKLSIFPNQFAVEVNFSTPVIGTLNAYHVPVDLAPVSIVCFLISLSWRQVKRAGDFLIKQNVAHRLEDAGIKPEREFACVTRAGIGVENLVQLFRLIACRSDDLASLEFESDAVESCPLIDAWSVKCHVTFDGIFDRTAENFAIGNVAVAAADNGWNSLDTETQIGARAFDVNAVRLFHEPPERLHAGLQFPIVQRAYIEIEVFECLRALSGKLCHGR